MAERATSASTPGNRYLQLICCALILSISVFLWLPLSGNASGPYSIASYQLPPRAEIEASVMRVRDLLLARHGETDVDYRTQAHKRQVKA